MAPARISISSSDDIRPINSISSPVVEKLKGVHTAITEIDDDSQSDSDETMASHPSCSPKLLGDFSIEAEYFRLSFDVLNVLEKYGTHIGLPDTTAPVGHVPWSGKLRFLPHVYHRISRSMPVQLTMPAFPCKSLNRENKVLGHLPDLGEELALRRLNAMAEDVKKVYNLGAVVNIASDGVLFNDVLGISDQNCWDYGVELQAIIKEKKLDNIRFRPCMSVLGFICDDDLTEKVFLDTAQRCREELEARFAPTEQHLTDLIKSDKDTMLTYCGMVKFLQSEMETSATLKGLGSSAKIRVYEKTAKMMMRRSEALTGAIRALFPHHVRLSMHPSSGAFKLSIALIPAADGGFQKSHWHSCIAMGLNGQPTCVHSEEVRDTHDLILRDERPYYFQERFKESFSE
ncbi:hypothetical protein KCU65_g6341, partial [Aureobasidium melanogenum]